MLITHLQETGKMTGIDPDKISRKQLSDLMENLAKTEAQPGGSTQPKLPSVPPALEIVLINRAHEGKRDPILLTPTTLGRNLAPYLNAIMTVQNIFNEVKGLPLRKIPILEIRTAPELTVRLGGEASEAIFIIKGIVNSWHKRNDTQINRYSTGNLSNRVEKTTLERSKVEMASQMLDLVRAGMTEKEKFTFLSRLIPSIDILIFSEFEIK
ncbi:MAG: hypothetical protein Fur0022_10030 [Anaerolineales bacterium]